MRKKKDKLAKYKKYALDVVEGRIIANKLVFQASRRYLSMFDNRAYYFNVDRIEKVLKFYSHIRLSDGIFNNLPIKLLPYQENLIYQIYGFHHKDTNKRVCKELYFEVARKNGKSSLIAPILLYELLSEPNAQITISANSFKQAKDISEIVRNMAFKLDPKQKHFSVFRDQIRYRNSKIFVTHSKSSTLDGLNLSCTYFDEWHEFKDNNLYSVLKSSQGTREEPLSLICTSAGLDKNNFAYEYRKNAIDVLYGNKIDDSLMVWIYGIDEDDDYRDRKIWVKANPSLGKVNNIEHLEQQYLKTQNNPILLTEFLCKHLGVWADNKLTQWIPYSKLQECINDFDIEKLEGINEITAGIDLSSTSDLTAVSFCIKNDNNGVIHYYFKNIVYLPESCLEASHPNSIYYRDMFHQGFLKLTSGNVVDYDYIKNDIWEFHKRYNISSLYYDSWNSVSLILSLQDLGLNCTPMSQSIGNFNTPTKELERNIYLRNITIEKNPMVNWCFSNAILKFDHNNNCKPIKGVDKHTNKIDIVIAMIQSFYGHLKNQDHFYIIG